MRLYRLVDDGGVWLKARELAQQSAESIMPQVVQSFVPSAKDDGWLSLFSIETAEDAEMIAAALRYNEGTISACHFAGVEFDRLNAIAVDWKQTPGQTYHDAANARHYEIHVPDLKALFDVISLFAAGDYIRVEQPKVLSTLQASAANDQIDLDALTKPAKINGNVATRTLELVKTKHLILKAAGAT
jgi:hypothetical protein